jgi:hypothetical protein
MVEDSGRLLPEPLSYSGSAYHHAVDVALVMKNYYPIQ